MSFRDFKSSSNRLSSRDIWFLAGAAIVITLVVVFLGIGNYYLANILPESGEYTLLRTAGKFFLFDHIDPYSGSVPVRVQELVYGRNALPGEDTYILDYPFHLMLIYLPLAFIPNEIISRLVWFVILEIALLGSVFLGIRLIDRKISFVFGALIIVAGSTSYYAYTSLLEGSPSILLGLAYMGILLLLRTRLDEMAGALLLLSGFNLEAGAPFLLLIILWVFWGRRWRVFNGAAMLGFILFAISFFFYPGWLLPFLRAAWNSFLVGYGFSTREILLQLWPGFGGTFAWILTLVLIVVLGYEWNAAHDGNFHRFVWVAFLTLSVTPLLGFSVEVDQLVLLTVPLILVTVISNERWHKVGAGVALMLLFLFFGIPWILHIQGAPKGIKLSVDEILFLFWPVSSLIGLYWMRWWVIHPPRTWLDTYAQPEQR